jgi:hypothetical protein
LTSIGERAFSWCERLISVTFPDSLTSIGNEAFADCFRLPSVTFPAGLTSIGNYAFVGCGRLTSVTFPAGLTFIGEGAFLWCERLMSITFPAGSVLTSIGDHVFAECHELTSITFPESLTSIGYEAFNACMKLTSVTFPAGLTSIGNRAFHDCFILSSVTFPDSLTYIGYGAFYVCYELKYITFPAGLTFIGDNAFEECYPLTEIINLNPNPIFITANVFQYVDITKCTLKVPVASVGLYQNAAVWQNFNIVGVYQVDVESNNSDFGSLTGDGVFLPNASDTLIAVPNYGYRFENWTGNTGILSTDDTLIITVTQDSLIIATFVPDTFSVVVLPNGVSFGVVTGNGDFPYKTADTLTTIANYGYRFVNWTVNGTELSTDDTLIITVTQDSLIMANFVPDTFAVSVTTNDSVFGSVTTGNGDFPYQTADTLTTIANYGYLFVNWTVNGTELSTDDTLIITVTQDSLIMANFVPDTFAVSLTTNDPAFGSVEGDANYAYNTQATLRATATHGYLFESWTSGGIVISTDNPFTLTVSQDTVIMANFVLDTFAVDVMSNYIAYGSIMGSGDYVYNTTATLTATANTGYSFVNWTSRGIIISTDNPFIFTVTGDTIIVANFVLDTFAVDAITVSVYANNNLYGSVTGGGNYVQNTQATLTATANSGYVFESWTSGGVVISIDNPFSFTVTQDTAMIANFMPEVSITETKYPIDDIYIYPNPVQDRINISGLSDKEDIVLTDISGRTLYTVKSDGSREMQIPVDHLSSGMYFVRISSNTAVRTVKVIKQ